MIERGIMVTPGMVITYDVNGTELQRQWITRDGVWHLEYESIEDSERALDIWHSLNDAITEYNKREARGLGLP